MFRNTWAAIVWAVNKLWFGLCAVLGLIMMVALVPLFLISIALSIGVAVVTGIIPAGIVMVILDVADVSKSIATPIASVVWVLASLTAFVTNLGGLVGGDPHDAKEEKRKRADSDKERREMDFEHSRRWAEQQKKSSSYFD